VRAALGLALALAAAAGCASTKGGGPADVTPKQEAVLIVDNQAFLDHTIYVIRGGGERVRIGIARGLSKSTFSLTSRVIGLGQVLSFLADPIGSNRTPISEQIHVAPGDVVELVITP